MLQLIAIDPIEQLNSLSGLAGLPPLSATTFQQHPPDAHWVLVEDKQTIVAHCSLWWRNTPTDLDQRLGFVGHYAAQDSNAAQHLLDHACQELQSNGCTRAIAPIDGNTWRRYRLLTDRGSEPLFFLEPDHPPEWNQQFAAAGFTTWATYRSALNTDLTQTDRRLESVAQRLTTIGVTIRSLNLQNLETELQQIYALCLISFRQNLLYTPIDSVEFMAQYRQIQPYLQSELVLLAEQAGQLVGFLFAIPDWLQAQRGETIDTIIVKTVAVLPGRAYAGLGQLLVERGQTIAHQLGYRRAIHALMQDANPSRNLSGRYAHPIRRYALLAKPLQNEVIH